MCLVPGIDGIDKDDPGIDQGPRVAMAENRRMARSGGRCGGTRTSGGDCNGQVLPAAG
jgi:hypothetical protein